MACWQSLLGVACVQLPSACCSGTSCSGPGLWPTPLLQVLQNQGSEEPYSGQLFLGCDNHPVTFAVGGRAGWLLAAAWLHCALNHLSIIGLPV